MPKLHDWEMSTAGPAMIVPSARKFGTTAPLEQVNWDLMMVNEISIEGYRYAIIFTDSFTGMIWVYGLRTKDQTLDSLKKWYCDITQARLKHKLAILMRDIAGENRCQAV